MNRAIGNRGSSGAPGEGRRMVVSVEAQPDGCLLPAGETLVVDDELAREGCGHGEQWRVVPVGGTV